MSLTHAKRRLHKDWKELEQEKDSLTTISALPTDNILVWHANLRPDSGPYAGTVFHLVLRFPESYPHDPPEVRLCSSLDHPNVFHFNFGLEGYYICLDMIQRWYNSEPYTGWTSAYSLVSLLLQLSAFLFDENVPQNLEDGNGDNIRNVATAEKVSRGKSAAQKFVYGNITTHDEKQVNHTHDQPWPPLPESPENPVVQTEQDAAASQPTTAATNNNKNKSFSPVAAQLPADTLTQIFSYLRPQDLIRAQNVCTSWRNTITTYNLFERSQISCFHTKATIDDQNNTILGIGLKVKYYPGGSVLMSATSPLDILSQDAFDNQGVRTGVWGGSAEAFDYFLPLVLTPAHASKAVERMERTILDIMKHCELPSMEEAPRKPKRAPRRREENAAQINHEEFHPLMAFQLLAILMNSMVVELMQSAEKKSGVSRHASEKALEGYCAFHHMLLFFAKRYCVIGKYAEKQLKRFLSGFYYRHKAQAPNLGVIIVCLTLAKTNWDALRKPLVMEAFDRNVYWLLKKHPSLADESTSPADRFTWTFEGAKTSLRLLMFQTYFMQHIGRPAGSSWAQVLDQYDRQMGKPTMGQKQRLQENAKNILSVGTWPRFFAKLGGPVPSAPRLVAILKDAISNSLRKRYHDPEREQRVKEARQRTREAQERRAREREQRAREEAERQAERQRIIDGFWDNRQQQARERAEAERQLQARLQQERGLGDYFVEDNAPY